MLSKRNTQQLFLASILACATLSGTFASAASRDIQWPSGRPAKEEYVEVHKPNMQMAL